MLVDDPKESPLPFALRWVLLACIAISVAGCGWGDTFSASSLKAMSDFRIANPAVNGSINPTAMTITLRVPYGTDVSSLVAIFSSTGVAVRVGGVEQASGVTANDFTHPVTYSVVAADGSVAGYSVTVVVSDGVLDLARTGQTTAIWPGDDGNLQRGAVWPVPRFVENADGTVSDSLTGLVWLKDANCMLNHYGIADADTVTLYCTHAKVGCSADGAVSWWHAIDFIEGINAGVYSGCSGGHNDWRLPNINEFRSLIDYSRTGPVIPAGSPFVDFRSEYWTSSSATSDAAWAVSLADGVWMEAPKNGGASRSFLFVWPVRAGQRDVPDSNYPANVARTGQVVSYYPHDDGDLQRGVAWPNPRFTNPDGSIPVTDAVIADRLTGLMWARDTYSPGHSACGASAGMTLSGGFNYVACLNSIGYLGYSDWRIPNEGELVSLDDVGERGKQVAWLTAQGFLNLPTYGGFRSSTAWPVNSSTVWAYRFLDSYKPVADDWSLIPVWPVRGGR